ncbi:MAG TPA: hypothetical protein ENK89_06360, partial [Desulfobulbaceae bacterium]|nr:hypothetical protein [Desulfobulbaceae bacterium]
MTQQPSKTAAKTKAGSPSGTKTSVKPKFDLNDPGWYLNRELTWLEFNRRVLHEGQDER